MRAPGFVSGATELHDGRPALVIQPTEVLKGEGWGGRTDDEALLGWPGSRQVTSSSLRLVTWRREPRGTRFRLLPQGDASGARWFKYLP